ncbi:MAG: phytoene/squalene synthase family protein [bacterium]
MIQAAYPPVRLLNEATPSEITQAYRWCAQIVSRTAKNFRYAFRILPKVQRQGVEALYAFCRLGDDTADGTQDITTAISRLQKLRSHLDLVFQGLYCDAITLALADAQRRFRFDREHFEELLKGMESDLHFSGFKTQRDLALYCYRVASVVGLMCLKIWGTDTRKARRYALLLGQAMQLTNILRDLYEDYQGGRVYIPQEILQKYSLTDQNLFEPHQDSQLRAMVSELGDKARRLYQLADRALPKEVHRRLTAARIMAKIYQMLLERVLHNNNLKRRVELKSSEKLNIVKEVMKNII